MLQITMLLSRMKHAEDRLEVLQEKIDALTSVIEHVASNHKKVADILERFDARLKKLEETPNNSEDLGDIKRSLQHLEALKSGNMTKNQPFGGW